MLDWSGRITAIIASGPSAKLADFELLRRHGVAVMAIKESVELVPWADAVYGCDGHWWIHRKGLPKFKGLKFAYDKKAFQFKDIIPVQIDLKRDRILPKSEGKVGNGGNSGFQALNMDVQFGSRRIILVGFDMGSSGKLHWYGRNTWLNCSNPSDSNFDRWIKAFNSAANDLQGLGVEVVNASPYSQLKCFRKVSIEQIIEEWGRNEASTIDQGYVNANHLCRV